MGDQFAEIQIPDNKWYVSFVWWWVFRLSSTVFRSQAATRRERGADPEAQAGQQGLTPA